MLNLTFYLLEISMQFKLTAFYAFGFLEIFEVVDPHKVSCLPILAGKFNVVKLINSLANCAYRKRKIKHSLPNLRH